MTKPGKTMKLTQAANKVRLLWRFTFIGQTKNHMESSAICTGRQSSSRVASFLQLNMRTKQARRVRKPCVNGCLAPHTPSLVAMAAHGLYSWDIVPSWSRIKFDRMRDVLRAKFAQHEDLRALLLSTGQARLVEAGTTNNAVNRLWGEVNGKGQNMLGVLLMEVRDELRKGEVAKLKVITKLRRAANKPRSKATSPPRGVVVTV